MSEKLEAAPVNLESSGETNLSALKRTLDIGFLDLGCSAGDSLLKGREMWQCNGVGIDLDAAKVTRAVEEGRLAFQADARTIHEDGASFRVVQGVHFLEHLPDLETALAVVASAARMCSEAIFFRQPWFDADESLASIGLKLYWSDWTGHPNHMSAADLVKALEALVAEGPLQHFAVWGCDPIRSSDHPSVHPLSSPMDQHQYEESAHGPKPLAEPFDFPVYRECVAAGFVSVTSSAAIEIREQAKSWHLIASSMSPSLQQRLLSA